MYFVFRIPIIFIITLTLTNLKSEEYENPSLQKAINDTLHLQESFNYKTKGYWTQKIKFILRDERILNPDLIKQHFEKANIEITDQEVSLLYSFMGIVARRSEDFIQNTIDLEEVLTRFRNSTYKPKLPVRTEKKQTVDDMAPVVINTFPKSGTSDLDPSVSEIKVTFSKTMKDQSWSWCNTPKPFPETTGEIHYLEDQKTCVMPCQLKPDTTYVIWINTEKFIGFQDTQGTPAIPYLLTFQTRAE